MKDYKITKDVALEDFDRWASAWRIEIDEAELNEEDKTSFEDQKSKIVRAVQNGYLTISEDGTELVLDTNKGAVTFKEPTGAAYLATDQHKKDMASSFAYMGAMTGRPAKFWSDVRGADIKIAQAVTSLFLAS